MIADDIRAVLPFLRQQAESMMVTECEAVRLGAPVLDDETGELAAEETAVYTGMCEVSSSTAIVADVDGPALTADLQRTIIKVPVGAGPFHVGDLFRIGGRSFRVDGLYNRTWLKSQRLATVEVL